MSSEKIATLIVDDNDDLASVFAMLINEEPDLVCTGRLSSADTLLDVIVEKKPNVVLLDLTMPGRDPIATMAQALSIAPECRFIILSGYDSPARVNDAMDKGAWGFVSKHGDIQSMLKAIRVVAGGEIYLSA